MDNKLWKQTLTIFTSKSSWKIGIKGRVSSRHSSLRFQGFKIWRSFWWCNLVSKMRPFSTLTLEVVGVWSTELILNNPDHHNRFCHRKEELNLKYLTMKMKRWLIIPSTKLSKWLQYLINYYSKALRSLIQCSKKYLIGARDTSSSKYPNSLSKSCKLWSNKKISSPQSVRRCLQPFTLASIRQMESPIKLSKLTRLLALTSTTLAVETITCLSNRSLSSAHGGFKVKKKALKSVTSCGLNGLKRGISKLCPRCMIRSKMRRLSMQIYKTLSNKRVSRLPLPSKFTTKCMIITALATKSIFSLTCETFIKQKIETYFLWCLLPMSLTMA